MDHIAELRAEARGRPGTTLVLPVLDHVTAYYVIACSDPPDDPWRGLQERLAKVAPPDLLEPIRAALGPASGVAVVPAGEAPPIRWELAVCAGDSPSEVSRGRAAPWHVLVRCPGQPARSISHQWAALAVARAIQRDTGGVLVDVTVDRLLRRFVRSSPRPDQLAAAHRDRVSTWVWVLCSPESDGTYWLSTDGLRRFGLPELSLHGSPPGHVRDAQLVLMGLAHLMVRDQVEDIGRLDAPPPFRVVPRQWVVHRADMAAAYPPPFDVGWMEQVHVTLVETADNVREGVPMLEVVFAG